MPRWFTYALSFNCVQYLETSMDSGLCAISSKHRDRTSYTTRARAPHEGEIARDITALPSLKPSRSFSDVSPCISRDGKTQSTQDCPEPPKGLLIVHRRAWSFWAFLVQIRPRAARRRMRPLGRFGTIPGSPDISTAHYVR